MDPALFTLNPGTTPVLVTIPHAGRHVPRDILDRFGSIGQACVDTDWWMEALYDGAAARGIGVLRATHSRYVVDLNRGADDGVLYPGLPVTGLVPHLTFDGDPIYRDGEAPGPDETAARVASYWRPYHDAITQELDRLRAQFGTAILWDAHSIRSEIPRLFEGVLPDLNIGTHDGASCAASLADAVRQVAAASGYSHVYNGRFKGGYTTRHYGQPERGIHAIQLELAQTTYLASENAPWPVSPAKADALCTTINAMLDRLLGWCYTS
ncbi:N-formylglutamate amidohydrolase [Ameyamaea chiangmaiensis NBRC 103196]|uniref:N-formylglutamate deformylase n=1 Tax=Ameyamaea chiangmaiensis TaxID=442969 RepID=A0A850P2R3_9PROT|nr:N-formylglutamate deformylase [Ameyamaea chiangmaiensis]MBS4075511.1 N-formylglutamate deformylase [Ameyamaea chiangmaiensis]NVN38957.1 N-formylglutamate deformylase [Ameyamaea chiangmaiensis]GBQ69479.1 N-formylglutamate amidohydrolase [Ameyamaea chiangmaiensis NBRC 103196]